MLRDVVEQLLAFLIPLDISRKHMPNLHLRRVPTALWSNLRIWKMTWRQGAYALLSFRPEDVGLFGMLLTGDLVYFQIAGIFGWAGTPAAFQVATMAISWELRHAYRVTLSCTSMTLSALV